MSFRLWKLPNSLDKIVNKHNYKDIEARYRIKKETLVVDIQDPLIYCGLTIPSIIKKGQQFYLRGKYVKTIKSPNENTYLILDEVLQYFDVCKKWVSIGYTEIDYFVGKNFISEVFENQYLLEDEGLIFLNDLEEKFDAKIVQQGALINKKYNLNKTQSEIVNLLPYHHYLNENFSRFCNPDSYICDFVLKMHRNSDYKVFVRFSRIRGYTTIASYNKKAYWNAPVLDSFDNLTETPVAYQYDLPSLYQNSQTGSIEKSIQYDPNNPKDRIEIYWKKLNNKEWQVEIEKIRNKHNIDSPNEFMMKYFHAIYDTKLNGFVHMDAAMRLYTKSQFANRYEDTNLDLKTFGKNQQRKKCIKVDVDLRHKSNCKANCKTNHDNLIIDLNDFMEFLIVWFERDPIIDYYFKNINISENNI